MTNLKPCPFCGSEVEFRKSHVQGEGGYILHKSQQQSCFIESSALSETDNEAMIAAWNTRQTQGGESK